MKASVPLLLLLLAACGNQGVGERCDILNLNLDCDDGLTCTPGFETSGQQYDLCCPVPGPGVSVPSVCLVQPTGNNTSTRDGGSDGAVDASGSDVTAETAASADASAETGAGP